MKKVLFIRPGGMGDAALLVPAILDLKKTYPSADISVLAERRNGAVFRLCPGIDRVYLYDRPADLIKAMSAGFDVVIDTEQWHHFSAIVARMTGAPVTVGFATNDRKKLISLPVAYSHQDYEAQSFKNLLKPLSVPSGPVEIPFLAVPSEADAAAEQLLAETARSDFVAFFPGASIPERRWPFDHFKMLAQRLISLGVKVVVIGGREDVTAGGRICQDTGALQLAGKTTLVETAAVISRSALLVTGDSGLLHIATGLGVPTVSLFGPGIAEKWAPPGEIHTILNRNLSCSPCTRFGTTPPCPWEGKCIQDITVDEVFEKVTKMLRLRGRLVI